jgi:hypothetical protein
MFTFDSATETEEDDKGAPGMSLANVYKFYAKYVAPLCSNEEEDDNDALHINIAVQSKKGLPMHSLEHLCDVISDASPPGADVYTAVEMHAKGTGLILFTHEYLAVMVTGYRCGRRTLHAHQ